MNGDCVEIIIQRSGPQGLVTLLVKQDGKTIATDKADLGSSTDRDRVVARLCDQFPALPRDELMQRLEQEACVLADGTAAKETKTSGQPIEPFRPFPVEALPEPLRHLVINGARSIGCDESYIALPALTVVAAAIGNSRRLLVKRGWLVPPILWTAIVGESGTAKTPAFKLALRAIRDRQRRAMDQHATAMQQHEIELAEWERDYAAWKRSKQSAGQPPRRPNPPSAERCLVSDVTVESLAPILLDNHRGLLMARDELAGWIGSFDRYASGKGGADSAHWLSVHSAESIIVDRKTGIPKTIFVPQASICVCGGIQPDILRRALSREHRESGLAARLLVASPPRKAKRWTEADIDPEVECAFSAAIDKLYELQPKFDEEGEPQPAIIGMTTEAKQLWRAFYNVHAEEQVNLVGEMAYAWSKLEEYAVRLALVIHYARWAGGDDRLTFDGPIDADSMQAGIQLCEWFKHEARRTYATLEETDEDRGVRRLAEWIERKGGRVSARDVQMGCRWLQAPGAAEAELTRLMQNGYGEWETLGPSSKGGRPTRHFHLKSAGTCQRNPDIPTENEGFAYVDTIEKENQSPKARWDAAADDEVVEFVA